MYAYFVNNNIDVCFKENILHDVFLGFIVMRILPQVVTISISLPDVLEFAKIKEPK